VFDLEFFEENPKPFYVLAKDLYPGKYFPTVSHVFISLLAKKHLLHQLFTQNIDTLERRAGIPPNLIVEAHGSFADQHCIKCRAAFPEDAFREHVERQEVVHCIKEDCNGLVKPDIVFFGEALPPLFYNQIHKADEADLVLVLGTSLSVQPFASLPDHAREAVPRVLFNMDRVGNLGCRPDDVLELGDCDTGVRKLAKALGWGDELESEWRKLVGNDEADRQSNGRNERLTNLEDEVQQLAENIERAMHIGDTEDANDGDSSAGGASAEGGSEYEVVGTDQLGLGLGRDNGSFRGGISEISGEEGTAHGNIQGRLGESDRGDRRGGHHGDRGGDHGDSNHEHRGKLGGNDDGELGGGDHGDLKGAVAGGPPDQTSRPLLPLGGGVLPGIVAGEAVTGNSEVVGHSETNAYKDEDKDKGVVKAGL